MRPRLAIGIFLIKLSNVFYKICRNLIVCILRPRDLIHLSKFCYSLPGYLKGSSSPEYVSSGLNKTEKSFLNRYCKPGQEILVLGCGSGRESIALAKSGFKVTAVDFEQECISLAGSNAKELGCAIEFLCQDITDLHFPKGKSFDAVFFSALVYSLIPSKKIRLAVLKNLKTSLAGDSKIFLSFLSRQDQSDRHSSCKKIIAQLTLGNASYEEGDYVEGDGDFLHYFSKNQIAEELRQSDLKVIEINVGDPDDSFAVLVNGQ